MRPLLPLVSFGLPPVGRRPVAYVSDDVHVSLFDVQDSAPGVIGRRELEAAGADPVVAYDRARALLARVVRAGLVSTELFAGPRGHRCVAFRHELLGPSCLVLPNLFDRARRVLASEDMLAFVPRRDVLVVAPDADASFRALLRVTSSTGHLFAVAPSGASLLPVDRPSFQRVAS